LIFIDGVLLYVRLFAQWRSTQFLDENIAFLPKYLTACLCLHNLVEATDEKFDEQWLQPEPNFQFALFQHEEPAAEPEEGWDEHAPASASEKAELSRALLAAATPARRRDVMAEFIWEH
jgi:hypothetical protein